MNTKDIFLLTLAVLAVERTADAQFSLNWLTIDGGGNASSGGSFTVRATIGQPDAALALTGGSFRLEPGFWSGVTVLQTLGAPTLKISFSGGGMAILSWPANVSGFTLEMTTTVEQPNSWIATPQPVVDTASEHTVTVPVLGVTKCYRLMKP
jgi:hypothetical protein